jgi:hypothetical protein
MYDLRQIVKQIDIARHDGKIDEANDIDKTFEAETGNTKGPEWQKLNFNVLMDNMLALYGPILSIMLTNFLSSSRKYLEQEISRIHATVSAAFFALIQVINLGLYISYYGPNTNIHNDITAATVATLNSILGIIVTFSFPERKDLDPPG